MVLFCMHLTSTPPLYKDFLESWVDKKLYKHEASKKGQKPISVGLSLLTYNILPPRKVFCLIILSVWGLNSAAVCSDQRQGSRPAYFHICQSLLRTSRGKVTLLDVSTFCLDWDCSSGKTSAIIRRKSRGAAWWKQKQTKIKKEDGGINEMDNAQCPYSSFI